MEFGLGHPQPSGLDATGIALDMPEAAAKPADRDRALTTVEMLVEQPCRGPSRTAIVPGFAEGSVRLLARGDRFVGVAEPPGGLGSASNSTAVKLTGSRALSSS